MSEGWQLGEDRVDRRVGDNVLGDGKQQEDSRGMPAWTGMRGQDGQNMTAWSRKLQKNICDIQSEQDSHDRTAGTKHLGQNFGTGLFRQVELTGQPGQGKGNRLIITLPHGKDSWDRTIGTRKT
jgi:hypothetical protein